MKRRRFTYAGNNRRGRIKVAPNAHPLVREFFAAMNEQRTTFVEIAQRTHVGIDTMRFWQSRHMPRLDLFCAALNALGLELRIYRGPGARALEARYQRECANCGKSFRSAMPWARFCDARCRAVSWKRKAAAASEHSTTGAKTG